MRHEAIAVINQLVCEVMTAVGRGQYNAAMTISQQLTNEIRVNLNTLEPPQMTLQIMEGIVCKLADRLDKIEQAIESKLPDPNPITRKS